MHNLLLNETLKNVDVVVQRLKDLTNEVTILRETLRDYDLNAEIAKRDETIKRLQAETLFRVTKEEEDAIAAWKTRERIPSSATMTYSFTFTSLGIIGSVKCADKDFTFRYL